MNIPWPYESIERELLAAFDNYGWLVETFGITNQDDYECCQEAILMEWFAVNNKL